MRGMSSSFNVVVYKFIKRFDDNKDQFNCNTLGFFSCTVAVVVVECRQRRSDYVVIPICNRPEDGTSFGIGTFFVFFSATCCDQN